MFKIMNYYTYKKQIEGYRGYIYTYDESGNKEIEVWLSEDVYESSEQAEDAAVEYIEENNLEAELG